MPKSVTAPVTPELLVWARKRCGLELAHVSTKTKVTIEVLAQWETGEARPSLAQLRELSKIYKTPLAAFFLPKPPTEYDRAFTILDLKDFRRVPEAEIGKFSPNLTLEIKAAIDRREVILDLQAQMGELTPNFELGANQGESPELLANRIRQSLSLTVETQVSWGNLYLALRNWISAVEKTGVLIFQTGMFGGKSGIPVEEMRGVAISIPTLPIVIINGQDAVAGRMFTLMHEFCHLLRRVSGVSDVVLGTWSSMTPEDQIEVYCNRFTAEMLVPMQALLTEAVVKNHKETMEWSDAEIEEIKRRYCVSREVVVRRLLTANLVTHEFYERKRYEYREQLILEQEKEGRSPMAVKREHLINKWHGGNYISTVLRAYHSNIIGQSDVADYLNSKTKYIERLERRLLT